MVKEGDRVGFANDQRAVVLCFSVQFLFFFCLSECDREACCVGAVYLRILFIVRHGGRGTLRPVGRRGVEKKRKRKE